MLLFPPSPPLSSHTARAGRRPQWGLGQGLTALAGAVVLSCAVLTPLDAQALALGRLVVQSTLGEPLRAEIDLAQVTSAEAASLTVELASPAAFRAAGLEFNPGLTHVNLSVQRRADGRAYVQVTGARAFNEPYLDLIVEASWSSGRIVRDYTLLFDPPKPKTTNPLTPEPVVAAVALPPAPAPAAPVPPPLPAPLPPPPPPTAAARPAPSPAAPVPAPSRTSKPATVKHAPTTPPTPPNTPLTVRSGDTAGRIAGSHKPANVSLEQMLVAMLRNNPQAFINGNINRIKAGAIIDLPDAQTAGQLDASEAKQTIVAQSKDFDSFRRRLASSVPTAPAPDAKRQATGKVQTDVTDKRATAPSADQLKLSKTPGANATTEEKIAQERQAQAATDRAAELARNIAELTKLEASTAPVAVAPPAPALPAPAAAPTPSVPEPSPAPEPAPTAAPTPETPPPPPEESSSPPVAAPDAPAGPTVESAAVEPPVEDAGLLGTLTDNPLALPLAGGLLALLAGFGSLRWRQRKKNSGVDSSYLESRLQPDSFFGASGGQNVDTAEAAPSGSSMMYSPSQLDAGGDVDPVAEADVYLAYGRDLQAEEILKEAMRLNPSRVAIHSKMLEIYAKRRDAKSFEVLACEVYALTQGSGPSWEHAVKLGQELDPANPLYQPGGSPPVIEGSIQSSPDMSPGMAHTRPFDLEPQPANAPVPAENGALDLDLDFSLDGTAPAAVGADSGISFDLNIPPPLDASATDANAPQPPAFEMDASDLSFDVPSGTPGTQAEREPLAAPPAVEPVVPDFELSFAETPPPASSTPTPSNDNGMLSFDLGDLSLDLGGTPLAKEPVLDDIPAGDPLETKLSLAAEFLAIGDMEGARSLAEEVVDQATGPLQAKARTFLADLG